MSIVADRPWQKIGLDFFKHESQWLIVVVDCLSIFFEVVQQMNDTSSVYVIEYLKTLTARYGIPETIISDNGTSFCSELFSKFACEFKINHRKSSPYH